MTRPKKGTNASTRIQQIHKGNAVAQITGLRFEGGVLHYVTVVGPDSCVPAGTVVSFRSQYWESAGEPAIGAVVLLWGLATYSDDAQTCRSFGVTSL